MQLNRKWKKTVLVIDDIVSKTETTPEIVFEEVEGQALLGEQEIDGCGLPGGGTWGLCHWVPQSSPGPC